MKVLQLGAVVDVGGQSKGPSDSPLERFHYYANRAVWEHQASTTRGRNKLVARSRAWPILTAIAATQCVALYGPRVRQEYGLGLLSQWRQQFALSLRYRLAPHYYYQYQLYNADRLKRACSFVTHHQAIALIPTLNQRKGPWDKRAFAQSCAALGLPHVATIASFEPEQSVPPITGKDLPKRDLIVKPSASGCGRGVELWLWTDGVFEDHENRRFSADELIDHVFQLSRISPFLIQPRLRNHVDISAVSNRALSTLRVMTGLKRDTREPVLILVVLRMSVGDGPVDNFCAGGIASAIDASTGRLGPACGADPNRPFIDKHPETGNAITGRLVPLLPEIIDLAKRAHMCFATESIIGWDIAMTPDGPVLVEANYSPAASIQSLPYCTPLLETEFLQVVLSHLDGVDERGSPRQGDGLMQPAA